MISQIYQSNFSNILSQQRKSNCKGSCLWTKTTWSILVRPSKSSHIKTKSVSNPDPLSTMYLNYPKNKTRQIWAVNKKSNRKLFKQITLLLLTSSSITRNGRKLIRSQAVDLLVNSQETFIHRSRWSLLSSTWLVINKWFRREVVVILKEQSWVRRLS